MIKTLKIFFYLFFFSQIVYSQWYKQTSGTVEWLNGISFSDENNGTAVGRAGFNGSTFEGTIIRTTNGGETWTQQTSGTMQNLYDVYFTDVNNGTAVGEGVILRTTNGGISWTTQLSGTDFQLFGVSFTDVDHGIAVGHGAEGGTILRTTNGGTTWNTQFSGVPSKLNDICFTDLNNATAVGDYGIVLRTTNGGTTWGQKTIASAFLNGVSFTDANYGTVVGSDNISNAAVIFRTTNGGTTWIQQISGSNYPLYAVSFTDVNNGIAVGNQSLGGYDALILRTTNGGETWTLQSTGIFAELEDVVFFDQNTGWTVGAGGTILKYDPLRSITVVSPNGGENWVVGSSYNITWTSVNVTGNVGLYYTTSNGSFYTRIIESTPNDGSYSWTIPSPPSPNCKVKVFGGDVSDESDNVFSIRLPTITLTSPNGGENWLAGSTQNISWTSSNVSDVKIEYSTNSGTSWITIIDSTPSTGSYSWTIPNTPSYYCKVKISNVDNLSILDQSNNNFAILQPSIIMLKLESYF